MMALLVLGVGRRDLVAIPSYVCSSLAHAVASRATAVVATISLRNFIWELSSVWDGPSAREWPEPATTLVGQVRRRANPRGVRVHAADATPR